MPTYIVTINSLGKTLSHWVDAPTENEAVQKVLDGIVCDAELVPGQEVPQ